MRRGPMDPVMEASAVAGSGLVGNANQGGKRQIALIAAEAWAAVCADLEAEIAPELRRANLLVSGLDLEDSRGRILCLGPCRLEIQGETRPCRLMEESYPGLQKALDPHWRGGVYGVVLEGGDFAKGDPAYWENP